MLLSYTKIQCGVMFSLFLVDVVWINFSSLQFIYASKDFFVIISGLAFFFFPYLFYKLYRPDPRIVSLLESIFFILTFIQVINFLLYLVATLNFPFIDSTLAYVDSLFRIESPAIVFWFRDHERWSHVFLYIYITFFYQIPFVIFYFSVQGNALLLQRFVMHFMMALILTLLLSGFFPAMGPYVWYDYTPSPLLAAALAQLLELRQGVLNLSKVNGIVTFPSFHALMAMIYIYTFRHERKLIFIPILILNMLMIFSCLPIGEHYFADVLGAIPVFIVTIWIDSLIYKHVVKKQA